MLKIENITYSVEGRPLFEGASATIPTGHKVGIVGRNGAGKTTLFRIIKGELALEGGSISMPNRARIGGVAQEVPGSDVSLIDTVLAADTERAALLAEAETATDAHRIGDIQARLNDIDAWSAEARAASILRGLGFEPEAQRRPCSDFSGGWRMRVALAGVLFAQPDYLLLDEPTNYLDLEGALWLESYLQKYPHTVIIISHDRGLLNRAVGAILHLDQKKLTLWNGPYDQFARQLAERRANQAAEAKKQDARRAHLQSFVDRFKAKASKAVQAQSRVKMLEKMTLITPPEEAKTVVFTFPEPEELAPPIINMDGCAVGYGGPPILKKLNLRIDQDDRIALLGRNGQGKSTLSKLLAGKLTAQDGKITRSSKLRIGYFAQHQVDELHVDETPLQHIQAIKPLEQQARLRARLAGFGLGPDQAETAVGRLSGGQKARLSLLLATIEAPHLLILDEPTNHLDVDTREALVQALNDYEGAVVVVSHDRHMIEASADRLVLVDAGRAVEFAGSLDDYTDSVLGKSPAAPEGSKGKGSGNKKDDRKAAAAAREATAGLRKTIKEIEAENTRLTARIAELDRTLADPKSANASDRHRPAKDLMRLRGEAEKALAASEAKWLEASEALESAG